MPEHPSPSLDLRRVRRAGRLYTGTSGFAYSGWAPTFYPGGIPQAGMLAAYARRLDAVELHSTFYRRPSASAVEGWVAATPTHFRFCPKAQRGAAWAASRGEDPSGPVTWLTEAVAGFGSRLGVVFLSLARTVTRDDAALARFLDAWPSSVGLAIELTDPSWADDAVLAQLADHRVALVATDVDGADEPDLRRTGDVVYLRLRRAAYDADRIARWATRLAPFLEDGVDVYAFFRHDEDGKAALQAATLASSLEGHLPDRR